MKKHLCPHCGKPGMAAHKVLLAAAVGGGAKCVHCSKHGKHPGWMKTVVSIFTIVAVFVLLSGLVREGGPVTSGRLVRSVLIAAALMAASVFLTRNVALLPVE